MNQQEAQILYKQIQSRILQYEKIDSKNNQLPKKREQAASLKKLWPKIEEVDDGK